MCHGEGSHMQAKLQKASKALRKRRTKLGRPAQLTRYGPLLLDQATPFQVPHPDGQGRYYMVDRDDFGRMRREAGGGLQRAAVRLEVGDMCASPLVPVATCACSVLPQLRGA